MKEITQKEVKWAMRLKKVLDAMPLNICLLVNHGTIVVTRPEEVDRYFKEHGHTDDPESLYEIFVSGDVRPNGESL